MTTHEATYHLCNAIINTFYPDGGAIDVALLNYGVDPASSASARDAGVFRAARDLCIGYVEGSHSENGVSMSVRSDDAVLRGLRHWCRVYGLDPSDELSDGIVVIDNASDRW